MIIIVSPSKTQHLVRPSGSQHSQPPLIKNTATLISLLRKFDRVELAKLMNISEKLADLTYKRIHDFTIPHTADSAGITLTTFQGDAFSAMNKESYSPDDFIFAHDHLRILSGLYGILRPLDLMQPYRLEMGTKLRSGRGNNLYEFWGSIITESLNADLEEMQDRVIVNCASKEYSRAVKQNLLIGSMLTITFKQKKNNVLKSIAIYAKRARGMFVDYLIKERIRDTQQLTGFDAGGYAFAADLSTNSEMVFITTLD